MDANVNLIALKKAYTDVILRISEDAAARVMILERNSLNYQHELKFVKAKGLRMLLRLKHMMDTQITVSEAACLSELDKIEELKAQLEEAEEIVRELREELEEVQGQLERVTIENSCHANSPNRLSSVEVLRENENYLYDTGRYFPQPEYIVPFDLGVPCRNEGMLPSIISRNEDPCLYINGRTQRIRACEQSHSEKALGLLIETDLVKDKRKVGDDEIGHKKFKSPVSGTKTVTEIEKKHMADNNFGSSLSFIHKRKRSCRPKHTTMVSSRSQPCDFLKPDPSVKDSSTKEIVSAKGVALSSKIGSRLSQKKVEREDEKWEPESSERERNSGEISVRIRHKGERHNMRTSPRVCSLKSEATQMISTQLLNGNIVKFTYQRKQKRELLKKTEDNSRSKVIEEKSDDRHIDNVMLESILLKETAREQRRLAQVARQLLSLSGKR